MRRGDSLSMVAIFLFACGSCTGSALGDAPGSASSQSKSGATTSSGAVSGPSTPDSTHPSGTGTVLQPGSEGDGPTFRPGLDGIVPLSHDARVDALALSGADLLYAGGTKTVTGVVTRFPGFLRTIPKGGGQPRELWSGDEEAVSFSLDGSGRAAIATYDYWQRSGSLIGLDLATAQPRILSAWRSTAACASVVSTPSSIFWTSQIGATGKLSRSTWDGSTTIVVDDTYACLGRVHVLGQSLIWLDDKILMSVPANGGPSTAAATFAAPLTALTVQPGTNAVYVAAGASILKAALTGDTVPVYNATSQVVALFAVSSHVFGVSAAGVLFDLHPDATTAVLASDLKAPSALTADDTFVYWAEDGAIGRMRY